MENSISILLRSRKTVFSIKDLVLLWGVNDLNYLKVKIYRLVKNRQLFRLKKGIFVLDDNYDIFELANKLVVPSYVTFETILAKEGVIFQYYSQVFCAARYNREYKINGKVFVYKKVKDSILLNNSGIINSGNTSIASAERAITDTLYLQKDYYFDRLDTVDSKKCQQYVKIYGNKSLGIRLEKLLKIKEDNA